MAYSYLESREDLAWLQEVHGVKTDFAVCAVLYGNEDSPERVEVFSENLAYITPHIWLQGADGKLHYLDQD